MNACSTGARRAWLAAGSALLAVSFLGCAGPDLTRVEQRADRLSETLCNWALHCCNNSELLDVLGLDDDNDGRDLVLRIRSRPADCREIVTAGLADATARLANSERAGRVELDDQAFNECLDFVNGRVGDCTLSDPEVISELPEQCTLETLVTGLVPIGEACANDYECADELVCRRTGELGICGEPRAAGESCSSGLSCASGLYCSELGVSFCTDPNEANNGFCEDDLDCAATAFCASDGRCAAKRAAGEGCEQNRACESGLCDPRTDRCLASVAVGAPCAVDGECGVGNFCDTSAGDQDVCVALVQAAEGERCAATGVRCEDGLACENGICVPGTGPGGWCDLAGAGSEYCPDGQYCEDNLCVDRLAVGESCGSSAACIASAFCNAAGECADRAAAGAACTAADGCDPGAYCDFAAAGGPTCVAAAGEGEDCSGAIQCGTDLRCRSTSGECAAGNAVGELCAREGTCGTDGYCDEDPTVSGTVCIPARIVGDGELCDGTSRVCGSASACVGGECQALGGSGADCGFSDPPCGDGLYCDGAAGTCAPTLGTGATCFTSVQCQDGLFCQPGGLGSPSTCQARGELGAPCSTDVTAACAAGLFCEFDFSGSTCQLSPGAGESCRFGAEDSRCAAGLLCDARTFTCESPIALGGACESSALCTENTYCSRRLLCRPVRGEGEVCAEGIQCAAGLQCISDGVCRDRIAAGEACQPQERSSQSSCVSDHVCDTASATCIPLERDRAVGETCSRDSQCITGECVDGLCEAFCTGLF
jgi:hypothetical protein